MAGVIAGQGMVKTFGRGGRNGTVIRAVNNVDLELGAGEIVGLVGESGCGKSTLSRMLVGLESTTAGEVLLDGQPMRSKADWRTLRRSVQYVFQDPFGSLCPTMTIGAALAEPLIIHGLATKNEVRPKVAEMMEMVGLRPELEGRLPANLSGGQRQRVSLARALMVSPRAVICDEIVSGLDVSIQAQVLATLLDLHQRLNLAILFISHDLRVVKYLCDRVVVMYLGEVVEQGPADAVFNDPQHEYTRALLAAIPDYERFVTS